MDKKLDPKMEELLDILKQAEEGKLVLPQFQRDFVWSRQDIEDLLVSLLNGYFVGTFLFLKTDPTQPPFKWRPIQGVSLPVDGNGNYIAEPEVMILDGQQRITSLHYVFYAPPKDVVTPKHTKRRYLFFLKLQELEKGNVEEAVFSVNENDAEKYLNKEYQFKHKIVPFTELSSKEKWKIWKEAFVEYHIEQYSKVLRNENVGFDEGWRLVQEYRKSLEEKINVWEQYINNLLEFEVPVLYLPKIEPDNRQKLGEVCTIFEKMNSTGVRLSVFDLLTARLYKDDIDLHKIWQDTVDSFEGIRKLSEDNPDLFKVLLLRALGLMRVLRDKDKDKGEKEISDVKNRSLINLSPIGFEEDWWTIAEYFDRAIERVMSTNQDGFGAFLPKWVPYKPMLPVLATLLYYVEGTRELSPIEKSRAYTLIKQWYWSSVFTERYSSAVESKSLSDTLELIEAFKKPESMPSMINEARTRISSLNLYTVSRSGSAIYRGIMNLIALNHARDFLQVDAIEFHNLEDHHIFPKNFLEKKMEIKDKSKINTILNRTLITDETNRRIWNTSPKEYLDWIPGDLEEVLKPHFIDSGCIDAMRENNYEKFLERRRMLILNKVQELIGGGGEDANS
ncbi:DUF262 domain-containing protein [Thermococcus sp.]|uniref:GmrSD restriction endonuclease domain-containing protein n=1 Tax=Thermococcus sp. TaxID=35749 RepID=UPI002621B68F|nr:DUF262 domain-containing protein [Thermococcus sp.]